MQLADIALRCITQTLFTKTQQRVLRVLFGQPERSFYASELMRDAGTGSGAAQHELARLVESKLIVARRIGHQKSTIKQTRLHRCFQNCGASCSKTVGLAEPLRVALKPLSSVICAAFVYGSVAKSTDGGLAIRTVAGRRAALSHKWDSVNRTREPS
jgi:hypothetical protein